MQKLRFNFGAKLVVVFSILIFFITSVICTLVVVYVGTLIDSETFNTINKGTRDAANLVDMQIQTYIKQVEDIANRPDIRSMDWDIQKEVLTKEASRIGFERFQVGYPNGDVISTTGHTSNAADRDFFKQAISGKSNISDVLFARIDLKMVNCVSAPIYGNDGKIAGILTGVTSASHLNDILNSVDLDYDGTAFIINKNGQKMAGYNYEGKEALQCDFDHEGKDEFKGIIAVERNMIKGITGHEEFDYGGTEYYASYTPMNDGNWFLAAIQTEAVVKSMKQTLAFNLTMAEIVAVILGAIVSLVISKIMLKSLKDTKNSMVAIAEGIKAGNANLNTRVEVTSRDEIGDLVMSFNVFLESLQTLVGGIKNSKGVLIRTGSVLDNCSAETNGSVGVIVNNIEQVKDHITSQTSSVTETAGAINEIASNITSLEKMIEGQSLQVEEATSAVEQMITNIKNVNSSMEIMTSSFGSLSKQAREGSAKQEAVNERIEEIDQQSSMLQEANQAIAAIAEQTNLLAMNAAIEAAHAGEAGKGFSVVADEIRKLSETSSQQSKTIGDQLNNIKDSISSVVSASELSSASFNAVTAQIEETDKLVRSIKSSIQEQEAGSEQIKIALSAMTDSTSEVRNASQEMAVGSKAILKEVSLLQDSTARLNEEANEIVASTKAIKDSCSLLTNASGDMNESIGAIGKQIDTFVVE